MLESKRHMSEVLKTFIEDSGIPFISDPFLLSLEVARILVGTIEVGGDNRGPIVTELQKTVGGAMNEPWCASFIQSCIAYTEEKLSIQSPIYPTEHVLTLWNKTPQECRVDSPIPGDIVIWKQINTLSGHCGLIEDIKDNYLYTFEGNTSPSSKIIERDGDGIYQKIRPLGGMGKLKEIGFLRPF